MQQELMYVYVGNPQLDKINKKKIKPNTFFYVKGLFWKKTCLIPCLLYCGTVHTLCAVFIYTKCATVNLFMGAMYSSLK